MGVALAVVVLGRAGPAMAQPDARRQAAYELAQLLVDSAARRALDEQVGLGMIQALTTTLQERLNRRLLEVEVGLLAERVNRFVREALPPERTEQITADVYARHFDAEELREMLRFHRSAVARKALGLAPVLARETALAVDRELRTGAALASLLEDLRRVFPVLGTAESP
jgi:hypothetical protein